MLVALTTDEKSHFRIKKVTRKKTGNGTEQLSLKLRKASRSKQGWKGMSHLLSTFYEENTSKQVWSLPNQLKHTN